MSQTTDIFPPDILPARSGVYLTRGVNPEDGVKTPWAYSYFDATDRIWGCAHETIEMAARSPEYEFAWQTKEWRGLAEEPKQ